MVPSRKKAKKGEARKMVPKRTEKKHEEWYLNDTAALDIYRLFIAS